jgi:hypothetical protein
MAEPAAGSNGTKVPVAGLRKIGDGLPTALRQGTYALI